MSGTAMAFEAFWPLYVSQHSQPLTRLFHFVGTLASLVLFCLAFFFGFWWLCPLSLIPGYGCAWLSHFFIEHNSPATFRYPFFSFAADCRMFCLMLLGRMDAEIRRLKLLRKLP